MAWTQLPSGRPDLLLEHQDDSFLGGYTSPWIETGGAISIVVAVRFLGTPSAPTVEVQQGIYATLQNDPTGARITESVFTASGGYVFATIPLVGRYFRIVLSGGDAGALNNIAVRGI